MAQGHAAEMRVEHTHYPAMSPRLGAPEVHNVGSVLCAQHLGFRRGQRAHIRVHCCDAASQNHFQGEFVSAHISRQVIRINHKHACGVHLRHPIGTRSLCLFAAPCHHSSRSLCPGGACARSLRASHHQFIAKAKVIRLRTCHPGVRLSVLQLMQLLLVCSSSNAIKTDQNCLGFQKTFFMSFWGLDDIKQLHRPLSALNMVVRGMFISFKPI
jgi:hypothetical protein